MRILPCKCGNKRWRTISKATKEQTGQWKCRKCQKIRTEKLYDEDALDFVLQIPGEGLRRDLLWNLGTVSHGTLRTEDLMGGYHSALQDLLDYMMANKVGNASLASIACEHAEIGQKYWPTKVEEEISAVEVAEALNQEPMAEVFEPVNLFESEDSMYDMEWLHDTLNEFCPSGVYFGAHPGDGADFGFWIGEEEYERNLEENA